MTWEKNPFYKGRRCLVCGQKTSELAAPVGVASGSFPACIKHLDLDVMQAYFRWCEEYFTGAVTDGS